MNDAYIASDDYTGLQGEEEIKALLNDAVSIVLPHVPSPLPQTTQSCKQGQQQQQQQQRLPEQQQQQQQQQQQLGQQAGVAVAGSGISSAINAALAEEGSLSLEGAMSLMDYLHS